MQVLRECDILLLEDIILAKAQLHSSMFFFILPRSCLSPACAMAFAVSVCFGWLGVKLLLTHHLYVRRYRLPGIRVMLRAVCHSWQKKKKLNTFSSWISKRTGEKISDFKSYISLSCFALSPKTTLTTATTKKTSLDLRLCSCLSLVKTRTRTMTRISEGDAASFTQVDL